MFYFEEVFNLQIHFEIVMVAIWLQLKDIQYLELKLNQNEKKKYSNSWIDDNFTKMIIDSILNQKFYHQILYFL